MSHLTWSQNNIDIKSIQAKLLGALVLLVVNYRDLSYHLFDYRNLQPSSVNRLMGLDYCIVGELCETQPIR